MHDEQLLPPMEPLSTTGFTRPQRVTANPPSDPPARRTVRCFWCDRRHPGRYLLSVVPAYTGRFATYRTLDTRGSFPLDDEALDEVGTRKAPSSFAYSDADSSEAAFEKELLDLHDFGRFGALDDHREPAAQPM